MKEKKDRRTKKKNIYLFLLLYLSFNHVYAPIYEYTYIFIAFQSIVYRNSKTYVNR